LPFVGAQQIQHRNSGCRQQAVRGGAGQGPFSLEDVVQVRLGKTRPARERAFGELAAADSPPQAFNQPVR
jgi:hypothetical protein